MQYVFKMSSAILTKTSNSKSCEKIFAMLLFDASDMSEKLWDCSIFEVDHAISFKNMTT